MAVVDSDKTKLAKLLTLHPEATIMIKNKRLIAYEQVVEAAVNGESVTELVAALRKLEPTEDD